LTCGAVWCAVLAVSAILRPLQLDEVLQLMSTRIPHPALVLDSLGARPGSVPVGYMLQWVLISVAGFSNFIARLPSIAALLLTLFAMLRIGTRIGIRGVEVVAFLAAVTPMLFRYSIEGRPYLPAFCLTSFATLLLLQFAQPADGRPALSRPGFYSLGVYSFVLTAGPLLQGTAASVTLAHAFFVLTDRSMRRDRGRQVAILAAIAVSLLLPIAWSLRMRGAWAQAIVHDGYTFVFTFRTAAGFLKDVTGGGLVLTALLFAGAIYGCIPAAQAERSAARDRERPGNTRSAKYLLGLTALTAICGAVASDALAGYFTSPRQAIYCLCGLIALAALGWERLRSKYPVPAVLVLGLFAAVALAKDVSVVRSKEDWKAASRMLAQAVAQGFCLDPASDLTSSLPLYSLFDPSLEAHRCVGSDRKVGLYHSTYTSQADRDSAASALVVKGFVAAGTRASGGTTLEVYEKRPL
jgi:4-amino-4-deoxy-L-arabinose transferase-like glycosyltransferase